jgi:ketosteroid isomerase-like protein
MFKTLYLAASLTFVLSIFSASAHQASAGSDDQLRKEVEAGVIDNWMDTYKKQDAAGMAALFAEDANYVSFTGQFTGREQIQRAFENQFKTGFKSQDVKVT